MQSVVIKPENEILKKYIDYFLFFKKDNDHLIRYATFPNNNLCLAIYKDSNVTYTYGPGINRCIIHGSNGSYRSRLFGFHKMPFEVEVGGALDQICILFHPAALGAFTCEHYEDLLGTDQVFNFLFNDKEGFLLEQVFMEHSLQARAKKIEALLLSNLNDKQPGKLLEAFNLIALHKQNISIHKLAAQLDVSTPTLFRIFKHQAGMSPKAYIKTARFRAVLNDMLNQKYPLTDIAYANYYFDQAHFIKEFKILSGYTPGQLKGKVSIEQQNLAWIYNNKLIE